MSDRYKGAILSPTAPTVTPQSAGGIYTSSQQLQYQGQGVWPSAVNYPINNSLRFRQSASAYLTRTPSVSGSGTTFTWSGWVKRGLLGGSNVLTVFTAGTADAALGALYFDNSTNKLSFLHYNGAYNWNIVGTPAYRDPSAWYHVVAVVNTTQATASNRIRLYVNGVEITAFDTASYPTQNYSSPFFNQSGIAQFIGRWGTWNAGNIFDGYLAEVNFIDGTALTPSSFGTTDAYGIWQPIPYTGAYGTNGFYLPFRLNTTSTFGGFSSDLSANFNTLPTGSQGSNFQFTGNFTIEGFVLYPSSSTGDGSVYVSSDGSGFLALNIDMSAGVYNIYMNSGTPTAVISHGIQAGAWTHVAMVRNGSTVTLYTNGVSRGSFTNSSTVGYSTLTINRFGGGASGQRFLSNVRAVKAAVYTSAFTPPTSPLTSIANTLFLTYQNSTAIDNGPNAFSIGTTGTMTFSVQYPFTLNIAADASGNNNNWTPNNISLANNSTYDSMKDVPTNTNSNTANYCVLNPLDGNNATLSGANLNFVTLSTGSANTLGSFYVSSGKWYWEIVGTSNGDIAYYGIRTSPSGYYVAYYGGNGNKDVNGSASSYGATFGNNDIIGVALDMDGGTITFYKNNTSQGAITIGNSGPFAPWIADGASGSSLTGSINFGQRPFSYTPPSGFYPLNTYNLPTPTILDGDQYFNAVLYSGNSSTQNITVGFQPDFVWSKCRNVARSHRLSDAVRGSTRDLYSDTTSAEQNDGSITSFISTGFSLNNATGSAYNTSGENYVSWAWRASNAAGVSNTQGTITSTVSANTTAGFSIVTGTLGAAGVQSTVGHGLGVAPRMIIFKTRSGATYNWSIYHASVCDTTSKYFRFTSDALQTYSTVWGASLPTSTVFGVTGDGCGSPSNPFVAYCFAQVAGYSAFGSYTGNGSTDGPFVYTGFIPKFVIVKNTVDPNNWVTFDSARNTYNIVVSQLYPNASDAEATGSSTNGIDFLSNGFKIRSSFNWGNRNGDTIIYMAFAENPFKIARGR